MSDKIMVEDLIDGAIIAGFQLGSKAFLESIEDQLRTSVAIMESGDANTMLQQMIDESEGAATSQIAMESLQVLDNKLSKILR